MALKVICILAAVTSVVQSQTKNIPSNFDSLFANYPQQTNNNQQPSVLESCAGRYGDGLCTPRKNCNFTSKGENIAKPRMSSAETQEINQRWQQPCSTAGHFCCPFDMVIQTNSIVSNPPPINPNANRVVSNPPPFNPNANRIVPNPPPNNPTLQYPTIPNNPTNVPANTNSNQQTNNNQQPSVLESCASRAGDGVCTPRRDCNFNFQGTSSQQPCSTAGHVCCPFDMLALTNNNVPNPPPNNPNTNSIVPNPSPNNPNTNSIVLNPPPINPNTNSFVPNPPPITPNTNSFVPNPPPINPNTNSFVPNPPPINPTLQYPSIPTVNTVNNPTNFPATTNSNQGCGYRNEGGVARIAGYDTIFGEFPWTIAVFKVRNGMNTYICSGSLIHPNVVLTVAHYFTRPGAWQVRAGEHALFSQNELVRHQNSAVAAVRTHPQFVSATMANDVGLLFLATPIRPAPNVGFACIPPATRTLLPGTGCIASSWGYSQMVGGNVSDTQKMVELNILDPGTCSSRLKENAGKDWTLDPTQLCAQGKPRQDTCKGDGGAPLVCPIEGEIGRYYQDGITSYGVDCQSSYPSLYTNVVRIRPWIEATVLGMGMGYTMDYCTPQFWR